MRDETVSDRAHVGTRNSQMEQELRMGFSRFSWAPQARRERTNQRLAFRGNAATGGTCTIETFDNTYSKRYPRGGLDTQITWAQRQQKYRKYCYNSRHCRIGDSHTGSYANNILLQTLIVYSQLAVHFF